MRDLDPGNIDQLLCVKVTHKLLCLYCNLNLKCVGGTVFVGYGGSVLSHNPGPETGIFQVIC
jgi:hypothetical protein